jgi:hypothetical protein
LKCAFVTRSPANAAQMNDRRRTRHGAHQTRRRRRSMALCKRSRALIETPTADVTSPAMLEEANRVERAPRVAGNARAQGFHVPASAGATPGD